MPSLSSRLQVRFVIVAAVVVAFAIGMAVFLNYYKFQKSLSGLLRDRVAVVGLSVQNGLEGALALGLDLHDLSTANALIQREQKIDALVKSIAIVARDGTVLYTTGNEQRGQKAPAGWIASQNAMLRSGEKNANWTAKDGKGQVVGVPVHNAFDLVVGYVALRYDETYADAKTAAMGVVLGRDALIIGAGAILVSVVGLAFVLGRLLRDLRAVDRPLQALARGEDVPIDGRAGTLEEGVAAFAGTIAEADRELDAVAALAGARA